MISTDFAPNEEWNDAWISLKLLFQPWRWRTGKEINLVKEKLLEEMFFVSSSQTRLRVSFFLTGRSALYHLLQSLDLSANDEVIVQGFTCEAVILPILANNLKPVYVDIESQTFSINPVELEKKITSRTKVVVLQHTFGLMPTNRAKVLSIIRKHNLVLIEDIAHGMQKLKVKSEKLKVIYLMSFGRSKALSSVFGGAIVTNQLDIATKLKKIEDRLAYPSLLFIARLLIYKPLSVLIKKTYDSVIGKLIHKTVQTIKFLIPEITQKEKGGDYDFLLDKAYPNALAILLLPQIDKYEQMQKNRAQICQIYAKKIFSRFNRDQIPNSSLLRFPLIVNNRDEILANARKQNIFLGQWYNQVVAPKEIPLDRVRYKSGSCPVAEKLCQKIINLPTTISRQEAARIIRILVSNPYRSIK